MAKQRGIPPAKLRSDLERGKIAPLYLLAGDETFFVREAIDAVAGALEADGRGCARHTYRGEDVDLATVLDDARTFGLFGQKQLVIVWPADDFVAAHGKALARFADSPPPDGHLVLVVQKADGRRTLTKVVRAAGGLVACNPVYERQIIPWISARAKAMGLRIEQDAAARLADFLGTDLAIIAAELEKLATYVGDQPTIAAADVEAVSLRDRSRIIFELTDAIGYRRPAQMLRILDDLLDQAERPPGIVFMVSRHMRRLWTVRELIKAGTAPNQAAQNAGVRYFVPQFLDQARAFSLRQLRRNCSALARCESELKHSRMDDRILLETAFLDLIGAEEQGTRAP
ncbi:MAG: DNA polymerase III subunit delta [Planctomycetota bacterium]